MYRVVLSRYTLNTIMMGSLFFPRISKFWIHKKLKLRITPINLLRNFHLNSGQQNSTVLRSTPVEKFVEDANRLSEQTESMPKSDDSPNSSLVVDPVIKTFETINHKLSHLLTMKTTLNESTVNNADQWKEIELLVDTWKTISTTLKEIEFQFNQIKHSPVLFEHIKNTSPKSTNHSSLKASLHEHMEKLKENPHDFFRLLNIAILHQQMGNIMDFLTTLANVTTFATGEYNFWLGVRYEYGPESDIVRAHEHYLNAVTLCTSHSAAFTNLATVTYYKLPIDEKERQQVVDKTISLLQQAIATDYTKSNYLAHYHLAYIYDIEKNDLSKAIESYFHALDINPKHIPSLTHCGSLLLEKAEKETNESEKAELQNTALKFYGKALELNPNDLMLHYKLATALATTNSIEDAMACMEKAIEIDPREPYTYYTIGNILYNARYLDDAISWYKKAIQIYNENLNTQKVATFADSFNINVCLNTLFGLLRRHARLLYTSKNRNYESLEKATKCLYEAIQLFPKIFESEDNDDDNDVVAKDDKIDDDSLSGLKFQLRLELVGCLMLCSKPQDAVIELAIALLIAPKEFLDPYKHIEKAFFQNEPPILISVNPSTTSASLSSSTSPHSLSNRHKYFEILTKLQSQRDLTNQAAAVLHYDAAIVAFQMNLLDTTLQHLTKAVDLDPNCVSNFSYVPSSSPQQTER